MYLVGLQIYCKMIHGPYNIKLVLVILNCRYLKSDRRFVEYQIRLCRLEVSRVWQYTDNLNFIMNSGHISNFIREFAKLRKVTISIARSLSSSFCMSDCSVEFIEVDKILSRIKENCTGISVCNYDNISLNFTWYEKFLRQISRPESK